MKQLRIALVGAGEIAQNFHLPILSKLPFVKLVAICDTNKSKAHMLASKYGIPYVCKTAEELLVIEPVDAVDICTSTATHYDLAISCIEAGKNVLIEKPVAGSLKEAIDLADISEKHNTKLMVGMNHRFRADAIMLKNYIDYGDIGSVYYSNAGWYQKKDRFFLDKADDEGHGVIEELGTSLIDLMLWLNGFPLVRSVQAYSYKQHTKNIEDVCLATFRFTNGGTAHLGFMWSLNPMKNQFFCNLFGTDGSAQLNPFNVIKRNGEIIRQSAAARIHNKVTMIRKSFESEIKHFIHAALGFRPVVSTAREAASIMRIVDAVYLSAREEKEIELSTELELY